MTRARLWLILLQSISVEVQVSKRSRVYKQVCRPPMEVKMKEYLSLEMVYK